MEAGDRTGAPEGWLRGGGVPTPGGTFGGLDQGALCPEFPLPNCLGKSSQLLVWVLHPQRPPSGLCWSWGRRREAGREQERQSGGALQDWRVEGVCPTHSSLGSLLGSQMGSPTL